MSTYWRHFDLTGEPFSLTPDPAFLYLSAVHAEAYAALMIGLKERRGLIAMVGEVGTGKTTLVYSLLSGLGPDIHTAYIANPRLPFEGILRSALRDFGVPCDAVQAPDLLDAFDRFLLSCAEGGTTAALVIDEAQNLPNATFEDLRLLTNFETYKTKLLQIVLVGQPELDDKLKDPALRQVTDRIAVRCHVNPLTGLETRRYIQHRLKACGGSSDVFTDEALKVLVRRSLGIPRTINVLAHNAMLFAYGGRHARVDADDVVGAIREREGEGLVRLRRRRWLRGGEAGGSSGARFYTGALLGASAAAVAMLALWSSTIVRHATDLVADTTSSLATSQSVGSHDGTTRELMLDRAEHATDRNTSVSPPSDGGVPTRATVAASYGQAETRSNGDRFKSPRDGEARYVEEDGAVPRVSPLVGRQSQENLALAGRSLEGTESVVAPGAGTEGEFRTVQVTRGSSLSALMRKIYGRYDSRDLPRIQALNPHIVDPDHIVAGEELRFPRTSDADHQDRP